MQAEKKESFILYLDERILAVHADVLQLTEDNRKDEANFEKIRENIFQISKTMFQVSVKLSDDEGEQSKFFISRLTSLTETWKSSLAKATEHNDEKKILQEQIKLEAMEEIRYTFEKIWGKSDAC